MKTVILADDDDALRGVLSEHLRCAGYAVHEARNGLEAIRLYAEHPGVVLVIDIVMEVKEGLETIREIICDHPDARIVAISGGGCVSGRSYLDMAARLGARVTLEKPFTGTALLGAIASVEASLPDGIAGTTDVAVNVENKGSRI